jgi:hypothetical protein
MVKKLTFFLMMFFSAGILHAQEPPMSYESRSCLNCHRGLTPGIVKDWEQSRHSRVTLAGALQKKPLERRVSVKEADEKLKDIVVGCFECHGLNTDKHADNFSHFGFSINVVVSPGDCEKCHPVEVKEYSASKKGHAYGNLMKNPVYHTLVKAVIGEKEVDGLEIKTREPSDFTRQEACFACHGTEVKVRGLKTVETALGPAKFPDLANWPNQGVGRINPDGTRGACTSCHARHAFSIEVARKPYTCAQCHLEPDVPAWNVYAASKHGNIFLSTGSGWDFESVPWEIGRHFTAPTCATCHVSLLTKGGTVVAERSHDFASRLWVRLFGLIYTHPQPKGGDTSVIKNKDGLPLPTTFTGEPASEFLIDAGEQAARKARMSAVCKGCHSTSWVSAHFEKMDNTLRETDRMTLAATKLLLRAWEGGLADRANPFDEEIEHKWIKQWLFYGNTARYASAMTGAQDYVAFKYGWWGLSTNLMEMRDKIEKDLKLKKLLKE